MKTTCTFNYRCNFRIGFFFALILISGICLHTMEWPVTDGVISKNFGWNDEGLPILGNSFKTDNPVRAADDGELLFRAENNSSASRLPSPLGSWVALDHGGGIIGIYSRMGRTEEDLPGKVQKFSVLGESGATGWSNEKGVYFSLFDRRERRWINPAMIITGTPDPRPPVIISVKLRGNDGKLADLGQTKLISQGQYTVLVEAAQVIPGRSPLAPYKIICSVNGTEAGGLNFENFSARDGILMVYKNGLIPARKIYSPFPAFELATINFSRGQVTMEVIAQNADGGSRSAVYKFAVE